MKTKIAILHGIFMNSAAMLPLKKRLESHSIDWDCKAFQYNSFTFNLNTIFDEIDEFFCDEQDNEFIIVGWSLGGIIAREYLNKKSKQSENVSKIITLGTPHTTSGTAELIARKLPRFCLLKSLSLLATKRKAWEYNCELHSIAGNLNYGFFSILTGGSSDGAVKIDETQIPGMKSHKIFNVNHTGLILSKTVSKAIAGIISKTHHPVNYKNS